MLTEKFQEKIAKLELVGDNESWGTALVKMKSFVDEEIKTIYSEVFGLDRKSSLCPCVRHVCVKV